MKFFITFALIVAVASAGVVRPSLANADVHEIIAAIQNPSTDPATAVALEQLLLDALGITANPEPIAVGPAIVDGFEPISVGPAIVDFPLPEAVVANPIQPSPVIIGPAGIVSDSQGAPLVQIILNINQAGAESSPVAVAPVAVAPVAVVDQPEPIIIVESAAEPVTVVEAAPEPVIVPSPVIVAPVIIAPEPVIVVENEPIAVEPVIIGTPIIPAPAVNLPETLN